MMEKRLIVETSFYADRTSSLSPIMVRQLLKTYPCLASMCVLLRSYVVLCMNLLQDNYQKNQGVKPKKPRKKTKPSALTRPPKKGKKKKNQKKHPHPQKPSPPSEPPINETSGMFGWFIFTEDVRNSWMVGQFAIKEYL